MAKEKQIKIPKRMGTVADRLYTLKEERLKVQRIVDAIANEEKVLRQHVIDNLPKSNASGIAGKIARVTVVNKPVPQVKDWKKFHTYIKRTNAFDLLQRRVSASAIEERWDNGKTVSGVEKFNVTTVSLNKV